MRAIIYSLLISVSLVASIRASEASDLDVKSYAAFITNVKDDIRRASSDGNFSVIECAEGMSSKRRLQFIHEFQREGFVVKEQTDGTYLATCDSKLIKISW
jgi:hypothetical protein